MSYRCLLVCLLGCATAGSSEQQPPSGPDASVTVGVDAPEVDAPACTAMTETQLLVNGSLDAMPAGMGWTETPINAIYPIITTDDGIAEQTPTLKAWMGGFAQANANDQIYQDVQLPAGTSKLQLTGHYAVATTEVAGAAAKDVATIELTQPGGVLIETLETFDNTMPVQVWTALDHTVANVEGLSGQTVRLVLRSSNDATAHTNFFFDSLVLTATHCQ